MLTSTPAQFFCHCTCILPLSLSFSFFLDFIVVMMEKKDLQRFLKCSMNFSGRAVTSAWLSLDWAQLGAWQLPLCICIPVTNTDRSRRPHCACNGGNVCHWLRSVVIKSFCNHTEAGRWRLGRGPGKENREEKIIQLFCFILGLQSSEVPAEKSERSRDVSK